MSLAAGAIRAIAKRRAIRIEVRDASHLYRTIERLRKLDSVIDVKRQAVNDDLGASLGTPGPGTGEA